MRFLVLCANAQSTGWSTSQFKGPSVESAVHLADDRKYRISIRITNNLFPSDAPIPVTETATKSDFLQPNPGQADVSLQLPYDRLRTRQTGFSLAELPTIELLRPHQDRGCTDQDDAAKLLAVCVALLYRYSGQTLIPVSVALRGVWPSIPHKTMVVEVSGQSSLAHLQGDIAKALSGRDGNDAAGTMAPVLISIADHESGDGAVLMGSDDGQSPDIHLKLVMVSDNLSIGLDFNESLFDRETVTRLCEHLKSAISAADAESKVLIADIPIFSNNEKAWFDDRCNGPTVQYPHQPIHVEFEACVALNPQKTAVRCGDHSLSYEELNRRANQIARLLGTQGIGEGSRIVACLDPSVDVVSTLLGILKSGATYVPVNPGHPLYRVEAILEDIQPSLIITQSHLTELFASVTADVMCIDRPPNSLAEQSFENPNLAIAPEQIAYIYYTSGTTGKPKGVMASHANMIHFIRVSRDQYGITASDLMPAMASYTFSISVFELMSPLSVGGSLLILQREHVLDAARMAETLQEVTIFHIGPSLLKNIIKYIMLNFSDYSGFADVRHASSGGDMVPPELLCDMQEIFPQAEIYVIYGCSEISLMGCTWQIPDTRVTKTFVGSPFANVQLLVLDDDGNQVPPGVIGDVCFGGNGVVTGYLNRPELTGELFFDRNDIRFYRTGDRGRLNTAGHLELLGRRDFQIQLRGMRIELGEIDYHLRQAGGIRDGIVAAKNRGDGDKVLVAYYVPHEKSTVDVDALRDHMNRRLPDYMVPTFFMELDALPLNHNFKVDRNALPDYTAPASAVENPPRTRTEIAIAAIWRELLHGSAVDVGDNFMSLGGDSLLAMQFILLVEKKFAYKLDGLEILRESLAVLAQIIDQGTGQNLAEGQSGISIAKQIYPLSSFYFGPDESLYGLYQAPLKTSDSIPVLFCPPIGYEYTLCQYFLHLLAENLVIVGVPSLRFDFFGSGDSSGRQVEATFARWQKDLQEAHAELVSRSGVETIRVFCFRLNTILAFHALREESVDRWVCWDPVTNGQSHYSELQRMTRDKARQLLVVRNLRKPREIAGGEELVGVTYSSAAIQELTMMALDCGDVPDGADVVQVLSGDYAISDKNDVLAPQILGHFPYTQVDDKCNWYASTRLTSAITYKSLLDQSQIDLTGGRR